MNLFGNAPAISEEAIQEVLMACQLQIPKESRRALDKPITLEELGRAVDQMPRNKVPGRDGIPVEFYVETWDFTGPVLLEILRKGLADGSLHPKLTEGLIVLLPKKGDQTLIGNKRGVTMLNCALKILTKLFQLRLSVVLQDFISEQQNAFLPGRSIHTALMLLNELLHKARQSGREFILLKLDTIKAFDCINWEFLYRLLIHLRFGPHFLNLLRATNASALASIQIQGRLSEPFMLKRSIRQGC